MIVASLLISVAVTSVTGKTLFICTRDGVMWLLIKTSDNVAKLDMIYSSYSENCVMKTFSLPTVARIKLFPVAMAAE